MRSNWLRASILGSTTAVMLALASAPAVAIGCGNGPAGFDQWLADFKREAVAAGISPRVVETALSGVTYQPSIIRHDRGQKVFRQSFEQFSGRMISSGRVAKGRQMMQRYGAVLARIEQQFGVPAPVVVAIWGLETDYGVVQGKIPALPALATLAYDCRRSAFFQGQLLDALRVIQRGDLSPQQMRGAWAGEIGQAQFMPSSYYRFAVDFDGSGHADLINSPVDVLASIANYLRGYGWQRGAGWGPGQPNFRVIKEWNKADVYARTIALFADKLAAR